MSYFRLVEITDLSPTSQTPMKMTMETNGD